MNNLGLAYDEASEAFYENNESLIEARENQAKMDEVQAKLGESVQNLKNKFFELFGPALLDLIDAAASGLDGIVKFVDGIGQALDWLKEKIRMDRFFMRASYSPCFASIRFWRALLKSSINTKKTPRCGTFSYIYWK